MDNISDNWMNPESDSFHNHVVSMTHLDDITDPQAITNCIGWGNQGSHSDNVILDDGNGYAYFDMLNMGNAFPSNVFIDHTMTVHAKNNNVGAFLADILLQQMLDECEGCSNHDLDLDNILAEVDNCPNDYNPDQNDIDNDNMGDSCDDCLNLPGDANDDFFIDVNDIIIAVGAILSGAMDSPNYTDCQKSDLDLNQDGVINLMDIIEVIQIILGINMRDISDNLDSNELVNVDFTKNDNNMVISLNANVDIVGVQLNIDNNKDFDIELVDNSHIGIWSDKYNENFTMIALDKLFENRSFDSRNINFIINNENINLEDIELIVISDAARQVSINYNDEETNYSNSVSPDFYGLTKIYPNPFNPSADVEFSLPNDGYVELSAYDLNGREVGLIFEGFQTSGIHSYQWNASNLPSGVYYVRFQFENKVQSMKAVLMK